MRQLKHRKGKSLAVLGPVWDGQVGHDASEIRIRKWEFAANSTQSLGRHTWVGVAKKGGATRRLAGYSTVGRHAQLPLL